MSVSRAEVRLCAKPQDPRDRLRAIDRYGVRPRSLQRWIYGAGLSQAAERVYWELWDEACMTGDYVVTVPVAELAIRVAATESTVNRALLQLRSKGLIRRTRQAKRATDPFREPVALTEVRLPIELIRELPTIRPRRSAAAAEAVNADTEKHPEKSAATVKRPPAPGAESEKLPSAHLGLPQELVRLKLRGRLNDKERDAWLAWKRGESDTFTFSATTRLTKEEQALVLDAEPILLVADDQQVKVAPTAMRPRCRKQLDTFSAERVRRRISQMVPLEDVERRFLELAWSIEHGSLSKKDSMLHAVNLGLKLIREGVWTTPRRMPATWQFRPREARA